MQVVPLLLRDDVGEDGPSGSILTCVLDRKRGPAMVTSSDMPGDGWFGHGLAITVSQQVEHQAAVRLVGELDLASVPILTACLENLAATDRRYVRADLSGLSFIDCAGLGALLAAHHAFLGLRGTLVITGAAPVARRALRVTGLDDVLFIAAESAPFIEVPVA